MSDDEIRDVLTELLRTKLKWTEPVPDGPLSEHFSSLQRLGLMVAIEDHFDITLEAEESIAIDSMTALIAAIKRCHGR
jgi:acyl carrier protein